MLGSSCRPCLVVVLSGLMVLGVFAQSPSRFIRIDQLGYHPLARKIAVLRDPVSGFDAADAFTPGTQVQVVRVSDGAVVFSAAPVAFGGGAVHSQSGDRTWWFDFSALTSPGRYRVVDPASGEATAPFDVSETVYAPALHHAQRMYYYQRCGTAKTATHAGAGWADGACHLGALQDLDCRLVSNPSPSTTRDLSGGWHDAGDYNKYVNFADDVIHDLLLALRENPRVFGDQTGIPESGNGLPDLLDEIRYELDWMARMQNLDGSVLHKVSVVDFAASSPPSTDTAPRRYAPATASATISACGAFAHAARVLREYPATAVWSLAFESSALLSWNWLMANAGAVPSSYDNAGFQSATAEDPAYWQEMNWLRAAIHLQALTDDASLSTFIESRIPNAHLFQWQFATVWEHGFHEALLEYADSVYASAAISASIRQTFASAVSGYQVSQSAADPYRAWLSDQDHTWGSNRTKALQGSMFAAMARYGLDADARGHADRAAGCAHYLHGCNATGHAFLTNMVADGLEGSVGQMYHAWFGDGTIWDDAFTSPVGPPPGYLTGGVNPSYSPDPAYFGPPISPPQGQPIHKSYLDWNTSWPQNSWEVTECSIGYQSAYLRLLAFVAAGSERHLVVTAQGLTPGGTATLGVASATPGAAVALLASPTPGAFDLVVPGWTLRLDLALAANPLDNLLLLTLADPAGAASLTLPIPPGTTGASLLLQATQADPAGLAVQSAARRVTVR